MEERALKASEVIEQLRRLIAEHGDLEVRYAGEAWDFDVQILEKCEEDGDVYFQVA